MNDSSPIDRVITALKSAGNRVRPSGRGWSAQCPAHDDRTPSLSIGSGHDGRVLLHCHAGCESEDVVEALGLTWPDLFPDNGFRGTLRIPLPDPTRRAHDEDLATQFGCALDDDRLRTLAGTLGVSIGSLIRLQIGWYPQQQAFVFPERNAEFTCIGFGLRYSDGSKGFIAGGKRGLVIPHLLEYLPDPVLIVEGPTDTAAAVTAGRAAVGRPSAASGVEHLAVLLKDRESVIVADRDDAGTAGALKIKAQLQSAWLREVKVVLPPAGCKDVRDWLTKGSM